MTRDEIERAVYEAFPVDTPSPPESNEWQKEL